MGNETAEGAGKGSPMIPAVPRERWLAALADPRNAHAKEALQKRVEAATGGEGHGTTSKAENVAQRGGGAAQGTGKRRGIPTKLEAKFAREILDPMVAAGIIDHYECEGVTLRIAGVGAITPDFVAWEPSGRPRLFEVKGARMHESTMLRTKVHVYARPWLRWLIYARREGAWKVMFDSRS